MEEDTIKHYMIFPKENRTSKKPVNTELLLKSIYDYIQTNEIYFKYEPIFFNGVLIFGIIGIQSDHDTLKKILGKTINDLGCELQESLTGA